MEENTSDLAFAQLPVEEAMTLSVALDKEMIASSMHNNGRNKNWDIRE